MGHSPYLPQEGTDAIGYLGGGILALSLIPQIVKLLMTRSATDISLGWTLLYILGTGLSLVYLLLVDALAGAIPVIFELAGCIFTLVLKLLYDHTAWGHKKQQELEEALLQALEQQLQLQQEGKDRHPAGHNTAAGPNTSVHSQASTTCASSTPSSDIAILVQQQQQQHDDKQAVAASNHSSTTYLGGVPNTDGISSISRGNGFFSSCTGSFTAALFTWGKAAAGAAPKTPPGSTTGSTTCNPESSTARTAGPPLVNALIHRLQQLQQLPWYLQTGIRNTVAIPSSTAVSLSGQQYCRCHKCGAPQLPAVQAAHFLSSQGEMIDKRA